MLGCVFGVVGVEVEAEVVVVVATMMVAGGAQGALLTLTSQGTQPHRARSLRDPWAIVYLPSFEGSPSPPCVPSIPPGT